MKLSNKAYDILKWFALIAFDAIGIFYSKISSVWGLPFGDEVLATCAALSLFVGTLIGVSSMQYKKSGEVNGKAGS